MTIRVRLFAIVKDLAKRDEVLVQLPEGAALYQAVEKLLIDFPQIAPVMKRAALAVNLSYAPPDTMLHDGDEVAIIPPVSGG